MTIERWNKKRNAWMERADSNVAIKREISVHRKRKWFGDEKLFVTGGTRLSATSDFFPYR
jgi:hypothetical protein